MPINHIQLGCLAPKALDTTRRTALNVAKSSALVIADILIVRIILCLTHEFSRAEGVGWNVVLGANLTEARWLKK